MIETPCLRVPVNGSNLDIGPDRRVTQIGHFGTSSNGV
jgi:hypothetical protein